MKSPSSNRRYPIRAEASDRAELRIEKFIQAATAVFLEKGYRNARLNDVVARSGGSLSTLYGVFGDKQGLALEIMQRSIVSFGEGLELLYQSELPPEQALQQAAARMIDEILSPGRIVAHRIAVGEGLCVPELRDWFMEHGVAPAEHLLTLYFQREKDNGRLVLDHPAVVANRFYMMVFGSVILRSVMGIIGQEHAEQAKLDAREAVSIFIDGVLPRP
ncbi:TetR/AcrR family transcriptional regulator [Thermomonas sp. HDW16]|uniref:TetR/AcrR family transcriptional regulator n=1 Tax=Thermomonas sp. HDW16 TaxID=2714945 RepID=UPI00140D98FE|nr:TetR/AcrR family transcriptional regulator [Thermomonas sp. HDW16]QIL20747.1 TetR/AcrR family transcriptional regulator [Thermomonas sp. HDW16]